MVETLQHYQKDTPIQVFSCDVCETFKDTFFDRTPPVAVSGDNKSHTRLFTQIIFSLLSTVLSAIKKETLIAKFFRPS